MAAVRHLGFLKFNFLTIGAVKRPILHKVINFIKIGQTLLRPLWRYRDFCDFQDVGYCHVGFSKIRNFNGRYAVRGPRASSCQISSKSVKRLQRYGDLTVFFKMAADLITCTTFFGDRSRGVDSVEGRKLSSPIDKASRC